MEQDYFIDPEEDSEEEMDEEFEEDKPSEKLDPYIRILVFQGIICIIVIITCLIIKNFFGSFFSDIKAWYDKNFNEDTSVSLVLDDKAENNGAGGPKTIENSNLLKEFSSPISGVLTSSYGYRTDPFTGEPDIHNGVDIAAESGTPIKSALAGVVEEAELSGGDYGRYIVIDHGGFKTFYAHCDSLKADVGEQVMAGDTIATVGSTGRSTGPHLHFEIRIGESKIDPTPFIEIENK